MKDNKKDKHQLDEEQQTTPKNQKGNSNYINAAQSENNPKADRVAKTERKGAGQQQNSSGGPINS